MIQQTETLQTLVAKWRNKAKNALLQMRGRSLLYKTALAEDVAVFNACAYELESALLAQAPQRGWQPIASAPKDKEILIATAEGWVGQGDFRDYVEYEEPAWWWAHGEEIIQNPTHWQPMPLPPNPETEPRR